MATKPVPHARRRLLLALISLLTLLPTTIYLQTRTPRCGASLILSAPAHGHVWYARSLRARVTLYPNATLAPRAALAAAASVVVLPPLDARAGRLLREARASDVPVVVLRRELAGAYREFLQAGGVMKWEMWEKSVDEYFVQVAELLKENRVVADWLWFDNVVWRKVVWLHRNGCHVNNARVR